MRMICSDMCCTWSGDSKDAVMVQIMDKGQLVGISQRCPYCGAEIYEYDSAEYEDKIVSM